jgi:hypothetical protein
LALAAKEISIDHANTQGGEARRGLKKGKNRSQKNQFHVLFNSMSTHKEKKREKNSLMFDIAVKEQEQKSFEEQPIFSTVDNNDLDVL